MRDEFNHSPEGQDFSEYSMPFEESRPVDFTTPKEYVGVEELAKTREFSEKNMASALEDDNNHKKQKRKSKLMSYMVAASVAVLTVTGAALPESTSAVERNGQWGYANDIYEEKPQLPNLEPNGAVTVPEYGLYDVILDEEFLIYGDGTYEYALVAGEKRIDLPVSQGTEEIYYDADTNTLHLNNCDIDYINANMMGNSFTIDVEGTCHVGYILVWGFYSGGSVTFTGETGTLYINENDMYAMGIQLLAENSMSGVFIDEMKGLYVSGYESPIVAFDTTMEHPLYWKTADMQLKEECQYDTDEINGIYTVHIGPKNTGNNTLSFLPAMQSTEDFDLHWNTADIGATCIKDGEVVFECGNLIGKTFGEVVIPLTQKYSDSMHNYYSLDKLEEYKNPSEEKNVYWVDSGKTNWIELTNPSNCGMRVEAIIYNPTNQKVPVVDCQILGIRMQSYNFSDGMGWKYVDKVSFHIGAVAFDMNPNDIIYERLVDADANYFRNEDTKMFVGAGFINKNVYEIVFWNANLPGMEAFTYDK